MTTSYVPNKPSSISGTIANDGFFPEIDLGHFISVVRLNDTITEERIRYGLAQAILETNDQLEVLKPNNPFIPDNVPLIEGVSKQVLLYQKAVYSLTRVTLLQEMRDYDYVDHGDAPDLQAMIDDEQKRHTNALSALLGKPSKHIRLI